MWINTLLVIAFILSGLQAFHVRRLLSAVLWLAVTSALIATTLYRAGAPEIAAMELSVGAGLVTVMFVFSIAIAGEEAMEARTMISPALAWLLIVAAAVLLALPILPIEPLEAAASEVPFSTMLWEERGLDVLVQVGLIFTGVLGILGLLTEPAVERKRETAVDEKTAAKPVPGFGIPAFQPVAGRQDAGAPILEERI
jgi:uncharacterized MnhB-related membrane protein